MYLLLSGYLGTITDRSLVGKLSIFRFNFRHQQGFSHQNPAFRDLPQVMASFCALVHEAPSFARDANVRLINLPVV
jgi:hypothetical protein